MSCGVGHRHGSHLSLLWLWYRPAAVTQIQPIAWELPYAWSAALKRKKKKFNLNHDFRFSKLWEAAEGQTWGETMGGSHSTSRNFSSGKLHEDQKRRLNKPRLFPGLWESEASCWFYSTLGQTRNHSPGWEPPILKDVGHLEQEQPSIKRWHHWAPQNPHLRQWVMGRLQKTDMVLLAQICTKPHTPDNQRSGKCMSHVKILKDVLCILEAVIHTYHE